jgi:SAM-dependent methyltransferase
MNEKSGSHWDAAHAASWDKWFHVIEDGARGLSERMVELAALEPGDRVLDIATGLGEPAVTAARRVGPEGSVLATDVSEDMLAYGRRRAQVLGLPNIAFESMDAQALALPEATFDAVLCRWELMFVPDLEAALAGIRRCLKPAGRFVTAIWGPAEGAPGVGLSARVIRAHLRMTPPQEGAGTPFAFSDVDAFARRLEAAGFTEVRGEWVEVPFAFASAGEFTRFRFDRSGPLRREIAHYPEAEQAAAWQALAEAARAFAAPDGSLRMVNQAYCVAARA